SRPRAPPSRPSARDAARPYPMLYGENEAEITAALMAFGPRERGVPPARVAELLAQVTEDKPARPMHLAGIDALGRRAEAAAIDMLEAQVKRHGALAIRAVRAMGEARASSALLRVNVEALARDPVLALAYMEALAACDADKARERIDGWLASTVRPAAFRGERGTFALVHAAALARTAGFDARQREFLEHDAMLVRAAAAEAIAARPDVVLLDPLIAAIARAANDPGYDAAHFAVAAVEAVGERFPAQSFARTKCVDALRPLLADPRGPVRERAAEALYTLAHERHDKVFFNIAPSRPPDAYARIARALGTTSSVNVETDRGPFVIDVPIGVAPLVADRFIELVRAKFYDGLVVHRVEPLFVMQTGDPMGTGYGGTGKLLPDETGAIAFDGPGVVGLATAGRDTGDSQWFVTHRATPHLDGAYTAFGRVASGIEVVLGIVPGDVIRRMTITGEGAPPPEPLASDELRVTSYECHRNIERQTAPNESTCRYPIASLRFHSSFVTRHSQFG
ncbi:peptidylprolyl isomerase, partial [bacterium]|nr:peptidylprolyl isomerase [bacterium]